MTTVAHLFDDYERNVIPAEAGAVQREECKRAFYAGALALFRLLDAHMEELGGEDGHVTDEQAEDGAQLLIAIEAELQQFGETAGAIDTQDSGRRH